MVRSKRIITTSDASGAYQAAQEGLLVMVVDVIDMSTTLESALDAGAAAVLGSSPDFTRAPVPVFPEEMGKIAGRMAQQLGTEIILVAEPRSGTEADRIARCRKVLHGIEKEKGCIKAVLPNLGHEAPRMADMKDKIVVAVTDTGGVAYDAAFSVAGKVITGTVARTYGQKGIQPAYTAVKRAKKMMRELDCGIAIVAASRNSLEDVLAAQYLANLLLTEQEIC